MRILHPGSTREISRGVGAPVAAKGNNFRLKTHLYLLLYFDIATGRHTARAA
jgi:hypothetical protein